MRNHLFFLSAQPFIDLLTPRVFFMAPLALMVPDIEDIGVGLLIVFSMPLLKLE